MRWLVYPLLLVLILTAGCDVLPFGGNEPPVAYIDSISTSEAAAGEPVAFVGHGTDADGTIVGYKWRSDVDGDLSTLATFNSSELSEGYHIIYLTVQDNNGDWSEEASSEITVGATSSTEEAAEEGSFEEVEPGASTESGTSTALPYINYLTAEPAVIASGGASVVRWSVSNAQSVTGSYDSTVIPLPTTGSGTVRPTRTTIYTVSATSGASTVSATVTVTVQGSAPAEEPTPTEESAVGLPVITLTATPANIEPGMSATITWEVSNATQLTMTSPTGTKSLTHMAGSTDVSPTTTTTYTFTATNTAGSKSSHIIVNVQEPEPKTVNLARVSGESGSINSDHIVSTQVIVGDSTSNKPSRAYASWDISSLSGKEIEKAELLIQQTVTGKPWPDLGTFGVYRVDWGAHALKPGDYSLTGPAIVANLSQSALSGPINVTSAVRAAVAGHENRFQVRFNFVKATDNDNKADNSSLVKSNLKVTYR